LSESATHLAVLLRDLQKGRATEQRLVEALRSLPEFGVFDETHQSIGGASVIATLSSLATWMLARAARVGCDTVIGDLYRYLNTDQVPFRKIMVLAGVRTDHSLCLENNIELIPFESLPPSVWKTSISDSFGKSWENYKPTAALQQCFYKPRKDLHRLPPPGYTEKAEFQDIEDVRLCMTVLGCYAPLWLGSWIQSEDWVPNLANMAHLPPRLNAGNYPRAIGEQWDGLDILHRRWCTLDVKRKKHLRIALSRLNAALRRTELTDSAIDLGIALDAVFLSGTPTDRGELGLTLRLRAAWYLGRDFAERSSLSALFSRLYALRNKAVHAGVVDATDAQATLNEGIFCLSKAIRRIIDEGEPNWSTVILGEQISP
jgi:hypothetical protein